jgi:membrane fusion protein (multidrug efflux system)
MDDRTTETTLDAGGRADLGAVTGVAQAARGIPPRPWMGIPRRTGSRRARLLLRAGLPLALLLLGGGLAAWWHYAGSESTDDAFVEGRTTLVSARVPGIVRRLAVADNQAVEEGQLLLDLEPRDYQIKVAQAEAAVAAADSQVRAITEQLSVERDLTAGQVSQARAAVAAAASGLRASEGSLEQARAAVAAKASAVAAGEAELEALRANRERARLDFERMQHLFAERAVSRQEFDAAKAADEAARAQVTAGERKVAQLRAEHEAARGELRVRETGYNPTVFGVGGARAQAADAEAQLAIAQARQRMHRVREAERDLAEARLREARAAFDWARLQLEHTTIRAPMRGWVARRTVEVGQQVEVGQALLAVVSLDDLWVVANFRETEVGRIRPGQPVRLTVDSYPGLVLTGRVDSIQAGTGARFSLLPPENATGNFVKVTQRVPVKIVLDPRPPGSPVLRPGLSVIPRVQVR